MAEMSLVVVTRDEAIGCFKETSRESRASKPAPNHAASTARSSSLSQDFNDSGYSSPGDLTASRPKGIPVRLGGQNFFRFQGTPSKATNDRFNYVIDQVEPLLHARLKKAGGRVGSMAFRAMILGTNEEDASEYIVVLCPKRMLETVNDFFSKTKLIKELCEPTEQTPRLSVIVEGREPRLTAKLLHSLLSIDRHPTDFFLKFTNERPTLCGCSLRLGSNQRGGKTATFGGMIKVVNKTGQGKVYGMTVGHVFNNESTANFEEMGLENCNSTGPNALQLGLNLGSEVWGDFRECQVLKKDGSQEEGPDFDWALVESEDFVLFGPNMGPEHGTLGLLRYSLMTDCGKFSGDQSFQEVEMIVGTEKTKPGLLSSGSARFWSETAHASTPAYILNLEDGEVKEGDSGAWVVGASIHDVFGHTIAADMFGDAYVLPLDETFADIQRSLGAQSVQLASLEDLISIKNSDKLPPEQSPLEVRYLESGPGPSEHRMDSPTKRLSPNRLPNEDTVAKYPVRAPFNLAYRTNYTTPDSCVSRVFDSSSSPSSRADSIEESLPTETLPTETLTPPDMPAKRKRRTFFSKWKLPSKWPLQ